MIGRVIEKTVCVAHQGFVIRLYPFVSEGSRFCEVVKILIAAGIMAVVERRPVPMVDALRDGPNEACDDSAGDRQQPEEGDDFT